MKLLIAVSSYIILIPTALAIARYKKIDFSQRQLSFLIFYACVIQLVFVGLWHFSIPNLPLFHLYPIGELILLSILYNRHLKMVYPTNLVWVLSGITIVFSLYNSIFIQSIHVFSSNAISIESGILVVYAISYFYKLLKDTVMHDLGSNPMFWINSGVLIYFSGSLVIFLSSNYLLPKSLEMQNMVWGIHAVFNILHYVLYTIALWVTPKRLPYSTS